MVARWIRTNRPDGRRRLEFGQREVDDVLAAAGRGECQFVLSEEV